MYRMKMLSRISQFPIIVVNLMNITDLSTIAMIRPANWCYNKRSACQLVL